MDVSYCLETSQSRGIQCPKLRCLPQAGVDPLTSVLLAAVMLLARRRNLSAVRGRMVLPGRLCGRRLSFRRMFCVRFCRGMFMLGGVAHCRCGVCFVCAFCRLLFLLLLLLFGRFLDS